MKYPPHIFVTKEQWLESRGGRKLEDVFKDGEGEYVLMGDGDGRKRKVYLPQELI
jgi:hypothetical protein